MSTETDNLLMDALADLSGLYPDMRFGQIIAMLALLSGEETAMSAADVEDDRLLATALNHARTRRRQLESGNRSIGGRPLPESRAELLAVLQEVHERHRDGRFGHLVDHLARSSGSGLYDVEDEQLLAAARSHPVG